MSTDGESWGVSALRTSLTGAAADTISDTGAVTCRASPSCCQAVFIDSESLPTGMLMPSDWHNRLAASTASNSRASSPGWPQAAIQLADSLTRSSATSALAMLVSASPMAILALAAASTMASGERSPIDIASPQ